MRQVLLSAIAVLLVVLGSAGASATECFTGTETVDGDTHSINLRNRCQRSMYWRMCITYTWRGTQHFSGAQNPRTATRYDVTVPQAGGYFHWHAIWSEGTPAEPSCDPPRPQ